MFLAGALEVKGEQETGCKDRKLVQPLVHTWSADTGLFVPKPSTMWASRAAACLTWLASSVDVRWRPLL
jgi:hypothetical protein